MLACALARAVKQVRESSDRPYSSPISADHSTYEPTEGICTSGDAYYLAAKKRLGLLEVTLTSVQCFFLAGLYEMCCMKPASAWLHYSQACSRLAIILSQDRLGEHRQRPNFHVLERLYFSCYRTELSVSGPVPEFHARAEANLSYSDLREELHLPPSIITTFEFPSGFPSLPSWTSFRYGANLNISHTKPNSESFPPNVMQQEEEQSWYYYLACIALRKEATSIVQLLYTPGELSWMDSVEHLIHQAALHESELDQWRTLLPHNLKFDPDEGAPDDLAFILECRQLQWRQISYRPLLYYVLHRPNHDPHLPVVLPSAQKCLEYCALTIRCLLRPHHYEGTWFIQRAIATAALLILAAQIRGPPLYVPGWETLVSSCLQALAVCKRAAQDLDRARLILQRILGEVSEGRPCSL